MAGKNDFRALIDDLEESYQGAQKRIMDVLREQSIITAAKVKMGMPVFSGRSKASWGIYTRDDLSNNPPRDNYSTWVKRRAESSPDDAIWIEDGENMEIVQGSNVPEVEALNDGWSAQAPGGFIDVILDEALDRTEQAIMDEVYEIMMGR